MWKALLLSIAIAAIAACNNTTAPVATGTDEPDDAEGRIYLQALAEAIETADRIVVTEHSYDYDAYDFEQQKPLLDPPLVYVTRELDAEQKQKFMTLIAGLDPTTQDAFAACIFQPHHTVAFYRNDKTASAMRICFECGQVRWQGTSATPPWSLYGGLATFVSGLGMQPDRDWPALAQQHLK